MYSKLPDFGSSLSLKNFRDCSQLSADSASFVTMTTFSKSFVLLAIASKFKYSCKANGPAPSVSPLHVLVGSLIVGVKSTGDFLTKRLLNVFNLFVGY